jgi:circadian clock protein KaiC
MLFFRQVELCGRLHRVASVLKMRESGYDPHVREFEINSEGLRVLGPLASAEGLLTGVARYLPRQENKEQ